MSPDWADKPEAVPYSDLSNPQSLNLYNYVKNNPLRSVDADGHEDDEDDGQSGQAAVALTAAATTGEISAGGAAVAGAGLLGPSAAGMGLVLALPPAQVSDGCAPMCDYMYIPAPSLGKGANPTPSTGSNIESSQQEATPEPQTSTSGAGARKGGGENADTKLGREKHQEFADKAKAKGWETGKRYIDPKTGKTVIPDTMTRSGHPLELKPNSRSGRARGRRQLKAQERATGKKRRVIYYDKL